MNRGQINSLTLFGSETLRSVCGNMLSGVSNPGKDFLEIISDHIVIAYVMGTEILRFKPDCLCFGNIKALAMH